MADRPTQQAPSLARRVELLAPAGGPKPFAAALAAGADAIYLGMGTMNARRKEAMAAQVIFTNACTMDEYVDDFEHFEEREVRYFDGDSNPAIYTPTADWTTTEASGKQIINDVAAMVSMLTSRGLAATDVLVAPDVADIILNNEWLLKLLDNH